jgi:parallel beta-helix repeat protein
MVSARPAGTVFWLRAGTYRGQQIKPKDGMKFIAEPGVVFDGGGASHAFRGPAANVEIRGIKMTNYSPPVQLGVVFASEGRNWLIVDNEVSYNRSVGIQIGSGSRAIGNNIHHNGQFGLTARGSGAVVDGNTIANNNTDNHDSKWAAGGTKFLRCSNLTVRNNYVHSNNGPGLWSDIECRNINVSGNRVENNRGPGIRVEITYGAVVRNNRLKSNGLSWGAGLSIANSSDVEVSGNTLNNDNLLAVQGNRGSGSHGVHEVRNLWVHDNTLSWSRGWTGLQTTVSDNSFYTTKNNRFDRNTYGNLGASKPFHWFNQQRTAQDWVAQGNDVNGNFR